MAPIYQVDLSKDEAEGFGKLGYSLSEVSAQGIDLDIDPNKLFILHEATHSTRKYAPLEVAKHRLGMSEPVRKVAANLELDLSDTAKERDGTPYIGNITNEQGLRIVGSLKGARAWSLRRGMDGLLHLKAGAEGKVKVYDGNKRQMSREECGVVYDEMFGKRDSWRGEHLNTWFVPKGKTLYVHSDHVLASGNLVAQSQEELENCLMQDTWASFNDLTSQGIATKTGNDFYSWFPRANAVARFFAISGRAVVYCYWDPQDSGPALGVRYVREARSA